MPSLKLAQLPDRTPVKLTISVMPDLVADLTAYAALYAQEYGKKEALTDLIPAILASYLEADRSFSRKKPASRSDRDN